MIYATGNKKTYDLWESEGATGWSYDDIFPYFLKLEDNHNIEELDKGYHNTGGPITAEKINYIPEIKDPILEATKSMGYQQVDVNGRRQTGMYDIQATLRNQQRCSTAKAYLVPARDRPNLDILLKAFALKILFEGKRAIGVEFEFENMTHSVRARKEVIISNGSIRTPQLLMLSGIGPKEQLEEFNEYKRVYQPYEGKSAFSCYPILLQPCSRGEVTLNCKDPHEIPDINPNYYKCDEDVETVAEGVKICLAIGDHPAIKKVQAQHVRTAFTACEEFLGNDDKLARCSCRQTVRSFGHFSGTARMGDPDNNSSVVDPQLRVIGIEGLRVVSAAVFPIIPTGDTYIPTVMVAEKASDMIKKDNDEMCTNGERKQVNESS